MSMIKIERAWVFLWNMHHQNNSIIILGCDHEMFSAADHLASIYLISISTYPAHVVAGCLFQQSWAKDGVSPRTNHYFIAQATTEKHTTIPSVALTPTDYSEWPVSLVYVTL